MDKCREDFEKLPEINAILHGSEFGFNESINQYYHPYHTEHRLNYAFLMGAWCVWQSRQAEVDQLNKAMERQGKLAIQAMHEAHKGSRLELSIAKDIQASLKPELIESERQMNAQLTDENMKLEAEIEEKDKRIEELEEWNKNQARSIKTYQDEDETLKALLQKLIDDEYTTMRPSMAYDIQKALRGAND